MTKQKETEKKGGSGFGSMDDEKQREVARKGGKASPRGKGNPEKGKDSTPASGSRGSSTGNSGNDDRATRDR
jgi:general stress protein YciG